MLMGNPSVVTNSPEDFAKNLTTGVLIGTGVLQGSNDFPVWRTCPSAEIYAMLQTISSAMLSHHLVLPTLLLQHQQELQDPFPVANFLGAHIASFIFQYENDNVESSIEFLIQTRQISDIDEGTRN